jgi:hypothetical protein
LRLLIGLDLTGYEIFQSISFTSKERLPALRVFKKEIH